MTDDRDDGSVEDLPVICAKKEIWEVCLTNGIIHGDPFSPLMFVLTIDSLIKFLKKRAVGAEILEFMDVLESSDNRHSEG